MKCTEGDPRAGDRAGNRLFVTIKRQARIGESCGPVPAKAQTHRAVQQHHQGGMREALFRETAAQNVCYDTDDGQEGLRAFLEKRDPVFISR